MFMLERFEVWAAVFVHYFNVKPNHFYSDVLFKSTGEIFKCCILASLAALTYTEPLVTQSASTIYAITRLALVSMRQMLEGIV